MNLNVWFWNRSQAELVMGLFRGGSITILGKLRSLEKTISQLVIQIYRSGIEFGNLDIREVIKHSVSGCD